MGNVKKWSTGSLGNLHPDHSDRGNPNTKGLVEDPLTGELTFPGVEGYIEEDIVDARVDNRPLRNLVFNDITLENNLIDVASNVDYGVLKGKRNEFEVTILPQDFYLNPEDPSETVFTTPLRIQSGSALIDGQITRVGQQKIIYFLKDDNTQLFPPYDSFIGDFVIPSQDQNYEGSYTPVWSRVPEGLPDNFADYQIEITNNYTNGDPNRQTIFHVYRDWEDIVPYQYHNEDVSDERLHFEYDINFGQFSEGIWLNSGGTLGTSVDKVTVSKDLRVKDKKLPSFSLNSVSGKYEHDIITDFIFFDNISYEPTTAINPTSELRDLYVDENGNIYFINEDNINSLYMLTSAAFDLDVKTTSGHVKYLRRAGNYLFIIGSQGYVEALNFQSNLIVSITNFSPTFQTIRDVYEWDGKLWIVGDTSLWYTDYITFNHQTSTFIEVDVEIELSALAQEPVIQNINKVLKVRGNSLIDSSLQNEIDNLVKNPSFEYGGINNTPTHWQVSSLNLTTTFRVQTNGRFGSFKGVLTNTPSDSFGIARQTLEDFSLGNWMTLSLYLQSVNSNTGIIRLIQLDSTDSEISVSSIPFDLVGGEGWTRFNVSHQVTANNSKLRIEIETSSQNPLQIDGVQLEEGQTVSQFVEMFEYLFIGYTKVSGNYYDPSFAVIDIKDKYHPKFAQGKYGHIRTVNDVIYTGNNKLLFIDNENVYTASFLNNVDEYNRISIKNLSENYESFNFRNKIEKLETITEFNNRIYFGGTVKNKVLKFEASNFDDIRINISDNPGSGESLISLMGIDNSFIRSSSPMTKAKREFKYTGEFYESLDGQTSVGRYVPDSQYTIRIQIDDENWVTYQITSVSKNEGPWTLNQILNRLETVMMGSEIHPILESSFVLSEGLYSIGKRDVSRHLRGNIHKIVSRSEDNQHLYMIRGSQVYRSKFDPNILKKEDGTYPVLSDPDYFKKWNLYDTDFSLIEYQNRSNINVQFDDNQNNRRWLDIPVDIGYVVVPGTIRLKTNANTEVGFSEGIDFIVDHENNRLIRHDGDNRLVNSDFWLGNTGSEPDSWLLYFDDSATLKKTAMSDGLTQFASEIYVNSGVQAIAYQVFTPSILNIGHTYTASVYVKSHFPVTTTLRVTECDTTNASNLLSGYGSSQEVHSIVENGEWTRIFVSHTIANANTTKLRFELVTTSTNQMWFALPQLERNPIPTPYIRDQIRTRIEPDMNVWIDFTQTKQLLSGVDYSFNTEDRKVILESNPVKEKSYYFTYKYHRIFNPYIFFDSLPIIRTIYDSRDDYFIYNLEGRIWAINQFFSMLSLDDFDPILITYSYHYPRVDLIKLRNESDQFGNFVYLVKGNEHNSNPYSPYDLGTERSSHTVDVGQYDVQDSENNEIIYSIHITSNNFNRNDIYDRRIWVDSDEGSIYNISLSSETVAYFPFNRNFNATNGLSPVNFLESSKIVPIIKNFTIYHNEEVGAYHDGYQFVLRNKQFFPGASSAVIVDPLHGDDFTGLGTSSRPYRTVQKALSTTYYTDINNRKNDIIIENTALITENLEVDKIFPVHIWARSYSSWRGSIQNKSPLYIQGIYFLNSEIYPLGNIWIYYCTFDDSTINSMITCSVTISNCEFKNCHNSPIRVNDSIFPSPFIFPYKKHPDPSRDDGVTHSLNQSIATSDTESISPGDSFQALATQLISEYTLFRCLIHSTKDHIVEYDPNPDWPGSFIFNKCTIAHNRNLFVTPKTNLNILYNDCILYENGETRDSEKKIFDSNSNISLQSNFIDFSNAVGPGAPPNSDFNYGSGQINGRGESFGGSEADPLFVGEVLGTEFYDYNLRSTARGFSSNSPCLNRATDNSDLGCWDEVRNRTDKDLPRNIFTYIAFIDEGIKYPIVLNSEKITFSLEFKPTSSLTSSGVMFDTRVHEDQVDYIVFAYNNNNPDDTSIEQNTNNDPSNPYRFRLIVSNRDTQYVVLSPIYILSDADFQKWHRLSWTVNYEQTHNPKSTFDEKDRLQNIITFFHDEQLAVESYIKYDMNRDDQGILIPGRHNDGNNDWNFNLISEYVTIGAQFNNTRTLRGYYSELRIDNRFTDRKILDLWNRKKVPFNDPFTQVNENQIVKSFDQRLLNEFWSLKSRFNVGAKGNKFLPESSWKYVTEYSENSWVLNSETSNSMLNSGFNGVQTAVITATEEIDISVPYTFVGDIEVRTVDSRNTNDNSGIIIPMNGLTVNSKENLLSNLNFQISLIDTLIDFRLTHLSILEFFTYDGVAASIEFSTTNQDDADALGFEGSTTHTGHKNLGPYVIEGIAGANVELFNYYTTNNNTRLSNNSFVLTRKDLAANSELILAQEVQVASGTHVFSAYIYYDDAELTNDLIKFYINQASSPVKSDWTRIERIQGSWWLVSKTFTVIAGDTFVGIAFSDSASSALRPQTGTIVVDAIQLEQNRTYESPWIQTTSTVNNQLVVNKNLFNNDKATLFFRIKPRFDFFDTRERIIFEITGEAGLTESIRILYYFSQARNRGVFSFRLNDPLGISNATWNTEITQQFFYQWHNLAISYDFNLQRYIYFFDYFKSTIDTSVNRFNFYTDAYFGRDTTESVNSADIAIKDIIVTSQVVSDIDIFTWAGTYEFYKESLILNTIEEYDREIMTLISQMTGLSGSTVDLFNRLNDIESEIQSIESNIITVNSQFSTIVSDISALDSRMTTTENDVSQIQLSVSSINSVNEFMQDGNTGNWNTTLATSSKHNIYQNRLDINDLSTQIGIEVSERILGDLTIRNDISSNISTFGASLVGVQGTIPSAPLNAQFSQTTVEGVLRELAGPGRTVENIKANSDQIQAISSSVSGISQTINEMQDGNTGNWNPTDAINFKYNIYENRLDINTNEGNISQLQVDLNGEVTNRTNGDLNIRTDLGSIALSKGASLIGINDFSDRYIAETVEAALDEVKLLVDDHTDRIEDAESSISSIESDQLSIFSILSEVLDGSDGSTWTNSDWNLVAHENRLDGIDTSVSGIIARLDSIDTPVTGSIAVLQTSLQTEATTRSDADLAIVSALASTNVNQGASLIGIHDAGSVFTSQNVEGALNELYNITVGGINWKPPVELWTDLPEIGNVVGDTLIVNNAIDDPNETTAIRAQYIVVSTTGTRQEQWTKVQNIDREDAVSIGYDNTITGLLAENVQSAIDELSERSVDPTKHDVSVQPSDWMPDGDDYYVDIVHELGTQDVVVLAMDSLTGEIIGVDEIERINNDTVRIHQAENISVEFTVFGVVNSYSTVISNWTPASGSYYADVKHNFDTKKLMTSVFNTTNGERIGVDKLTFTDNNTLRITVDDNSLSLNVFVLKSASVTKSKDMSNWLLAGTEFSSSIEIDTGYDAVYHFFDTTTSKSIEVNNITLSGNTLTIKKSDNNHVRMIILK